MTQVVLPAEVKSIASGAFWNSHIESLVLNEGLESIELQAFSGSQKLASVVFPASLKEIGEHAFEDCVALTEIDLSKTALQEISSDAFRETGLKSYSACFIEKNRFAGLFRYTSGRGCIFCRIAGDR